MTTNRLRDDIRPGTAGVAQTRVARIMRQQGVIEQWDSF
jgi:hypothetical protein